MARILALLFLTISIPLWPILYLAVKLDSKGPIIFKQKRMGKGKIPFTMYKFRTMVDGAEKLKNKYLKLNEVDGPVFKIRDDPRFTKVGKIISRFALDELPQLLNVLKGEMALVGPRPLPIDEAEKIPKKYVQRFSILPGMTSSWVIKGGHSLSFEQWMELDLEYVNRRSFLYDLKILSLTAILVIRLVLTRK